MVDLNGMRRALVVKTLTDQIILVRTDDGELLSLSQSCRKLQPGTLLYLDQSDAVDSGCVVLAVNGENCRRTCGERFPAMIIEHRTDASAEKPAASTNDEDRRVV